MSRRQIHLKFLTSGSGDNRTNRKVDNYLPVDMASYPIRLESPSSDYVLFLTKNGKRQGYIPEISNEFSVSIARKGDVGRRVLCVVSTYLPHYNLSAPYCPSICIHCRNNFITHNNENPTKKNVLQCYSYLF